MTLEASMFVRIKMADFLHVTSSHLIQMSKNEHAVPFCRLGINVPTCSITGPNWRKGRGSVKKGYF